MLTFNLDHEAGVMMAIHEFVDYMLNHAMSREMFVSSLEQLIPAFKAFDQNETVSYHSSILAFQQVVHYVDALCEQQVYVDVLPRLTDVQVKALRKIVLCQRANMIQEIDAFQRQEENNQKELLSYVHSIIQDHYKVLVVRVDLSYLKESIQQVNIHSFYRHIKTLCDRLKDKNGCFKHLLGYSMALEQGVSKGYHAHLLLIYNGSERKGDEHIAYQVIQKWQDISFGLGYGFNLHSKEYKKKFEKNNRLGIGMIHRDNREEVENILLVTSYLTQPEKYAQLLLLKPIGTRSFSKGIYKPHGRHYHTKYQASNILEDAGQWSAQDLELMLTEN